MAQVSTMRIFKEMKHGLTLMPVKVNGALHLFPNTQIPDPCQRVEVLA